MAPTDVGGYINCHLVVVRGALWPLHVTWRKDAVGVSWQGHEIVATAF